MASVYQRATRYAVALPVRYRLAGSDACHAGWTENISVSGFLFTTATRLDVGSSVEVWVEMSGNGNGNNPAVLYCQGTVIRHADCSDSRPIAALHITRFRVLPFTPGFNSPQLTREHGEQL